MPLSILSMLFLAAVAVIFIGYDLRHAYRGTLAYWNAQISTCTADRVSFANLWLRERRTDTQSVADDGLSVRLISTAANGRVPDAIRQDVEQNIERMARINGFLGGAVADQECRIAAQSSVPEGALAGVQEACRRVLADGIFHVVMSSDPQLHAWVLLGCPIEGTVELSPSGPASRRPLGAAVMIAEPWERSFPFMSPETPLPPNPETFIVWGEGNEVLAFSPRLHLVGAPSVFRQPLDGQTIASRIAREGSVGFNEFTDFRGIPVFGVARPLGPTDGRIVCVVKREEALADFHRHARAECLGGFLFLLLLGSAIALQERHFTARDLTERLRQKQELLELQRSVVVSEQRLRSLLGSLDVIVWEAEAPTLRLNFVSQGAERILGLPPLQWLQTPNFWADHVHPHDRQRALEYEQEILKKGGVGAIEYRMEGADGQIRWFRDFMHAARGADGQSSLLRGIMVDITDRKCAEVALEESEERYRRLFEAESDCILVIEVGTGRILDANPAALQAYDYSREEFLSLNIEDVSAEPEKTLASIAAQIVHVPLRLHRKRDGSIFPVEISGGFFAAHGRELHVATIRDITERRRAEEALRESEERFRATFENAGIGMAILDLQGGLCQSNPTAQKMLGYSPEELSRMDFGMFTHPDDRDLDWELYRELVDGKRETYQMEKRLIRKDGEVVWGHLVASLVRDQQGRPAYGIGMVEDITERKRTEGALRQSEARFRTLIEKAPVAIGIARSGVTIYANHKYLEMYGFQNVDELVGRSIGEQWAEEERAVIIERSRQRTLGVPVATSYEAMGQRQDGSQFPVHSDVTMVDLPDGQATLAFLTDITERYNFVSQLRLQSAALQAAHHGIAITDREGRIIWANPGFSQLTGYQLQEVLGENPRLLKSGKHPRSFYEEMWNTIMAGNVWHGELTNRRKDGCLYQEEMTITPVRNDAGTVTHFIAIKQDVTLRREDKERLALSEERYRRLYEDCPIGIALMDSSLKITLTNKSFREFLKMSEAEIIARGPRGIIHPDDWEPSLALGRRLRSEEVAVFHMEQRYVRGDHRVVWADTHFIALRHKDGRLLDAIGWVQDITDRKQVQEELGRSFEQLRALAGRLQHVREEERKRLAREIHDQLGQALTALKLDITSLVRDGPGRPAHRAMKSASILQLVDETIQTVRRISTELRPGMLDDLGLVATVEWAGEDFQARTGIRCQVDLPEQDVAIDSERATAIFRILQETLTNVARHAAAKEVRIKLGIEQGDLCLEVGDNGRGFDQCKPSAGPSLGIVGMQERALLLGGELNISSVAGEGTTVRVRIPQVSVKRNGVSYDPNPDCR